MARRHSPRAGPSLRRPAAGPTSGSASVLPRAFWRPTSSPGSSYLAIDLPDTRRLRRARHRRPAQVAEPGARLIRRRAISGPTDPRRVHRLHRVAQQLCRDDRVAHDLERRHRVVVAAKRLPAVAARACRRRPRRCGLRRRDGRSLGRRVDLVARRRRNGVGCRGRRRGDDAGSDEAADAGPAADADRRLLALANPRPSRHRRGRAGNPRPRRRLARPKQAATLGRPGPRRGDLARHGARLCVRGDDRLNAARVPAVPPLLLARHDGRRR